MKNNKIFSVVSIALLCLSIFVVVIPLTQAGPTPAIEVSTTADRANAMIGDTITYTYEVTNTGKVTLFAVSVVSDLAGAGTKVSESIRTNSKLDTGETWIFTNTYVVKEGDADPLINTASATAETRKGSVFGATGACSVYLYGTVGDVLPDLLTSPNQEPNGGWYGCSVAVGEGLIVVGAAYESVPLETVVIASGKPSPQPTAYYGAGRVYVYSATTGALLSTLSSPNPVDYGWFGYSVAVGEGVIVIGAPKETSGSVTSAGNAYVYSATTRSYIAILTSDTPVSDTNGQGYGISVAVNDGIIAVGSSRETVNSVASAGKVYLYDTVTMAQKAFSPLITPDPTDLGRFGWSVAVGEGVIVVGAPFENIVGTGGYAGPSGRVYTYSTTSGMLIDAFTSDNPQFYGGFGFSVAVGDGVIVIGSPDETVETIVDEVSVGQEQAGRAYVYDLTSKTIISTLESENVQYRGMFGNAVAVGQGLIVVGAEIETSGGVSDAGNVYVFDTAGAIQATLANPVAVEWSTFGWSVAIGSDFIVVGAYDAVYIFE